MFNFLLVLHCILSLLCEHKRRHKLRYYLQLLFLNNKIYMYIESVFKRVKNDTNDSRSSSARVTPDRCSPPTGFFWSPLDNRAARLPS